ncbi:MAG TPA: PilZ domain-containing protein, partial [Bdellovibrionales bacterium]|nr:PilZ domain-containing protein [Bdellovibrionales bacterium]
EMRYGPFAIQEVLKLLQEKSVHDSDFIWRSGMKTWCMIAECADFTPENISKLRDSGAPINETYFRRRYARAAYGTSILVHDNKKVFKGQSVELSEGGAGIVLDTPTLEVGHKLYLHFKPAHELPSFNAVCEVVSRRMTSSSDKSAPVHYGVKFTSIERHYTHKIHDFTQKSRAA